MALNPEEQQQLAQTLVERGGYNPTDARNAAMGPRAEELAKEFGVTAPGVSGVASPEQIVADIMSAQQESIDRETKFLEEYIVENPFAFDEVLAKESATKQYEPYYSELLEDYLSGVELQKETVQDEQKLLTELHRMGVGERSRSYNRAVSQAEEGFAGQGMFFSGIKKRALGAAEVEYGAGEEEAGLRYEMGGRGLGRQVTALGLEEEQKRRDIQRQQKEAVTGGIETRRGERMRQYYVPFTQAYKRQFPTGTVGTEGYLPESFLQYRY